MTKYLKCFYQSNERFRGYVERCAANVERCAANYRVTEILSGGWRT